MDIPAATLASLVCSKCEQLLKRGPVYQQHDGAAVCGLCQAREVAQPASRCLLYEATAQLLRFPCRYQEEGCLTTVPFVAAGSMEFNHEDACEYRQYMCPVLDSNHCDWGGRRNQLLQHCQDKHPDRVLSNPTAITPDIRRSQHTDYIISAFHFLFLLQTQVCVKTAKLHYTVRLLADPQQASNYYFTITVHRGENIIIQSRDVIPQELLVLQEHPALILSTSSLLGVLGGWDGVSLSVEVKAHGPQVEPKQERAPKRRRVKQEQEQCGENWERMLLPRQFQDEQCYAPQMVTCRNEGCDFQDIGVEKRDKHSYWFCQWRFMCPLESCDAFLHPGMPSPWQQHYTTCKSFKIIPTGSRFIIQCDNNEHWFLIETASGHVLCGCKYTDHNFYLCVLVPLPCEQLHLQRCEVRLECAGNTRTHTPDTKFDKRWDWAIVCEDEEDKFFTDHEVHVSLAVNKMEKTEENTCGAGFSCTKDY